MKKSIVLWGLLLPAILMAQSEINVPVAIKKMILLIIPTTWVQQDNA